MNQINPEETTDGAPTNASLRCFTADNIAGMTPVEFSEMRDEIIDFTMMSNPDAVDQLLEFESTLTSLKSGDCAEMRPFYENALEQYPLLQTVWQFCLTACEVDRGTKFEGVRCF